jgi:hypothetical protein
MVDVCFEDSGIVERRPGTQLLAMNPAPDLRVTQKADGWYVAGQRYKTQAAATTALIAAFSASPAPAKKPRAVREVAPEEKTSADIYDPAKEQFRAVVQGVYESLVTKELGVSAFKDARGKRVDEKALRSGKVAQADLRALLSRAYAIATRQGQKYGYLEAGTQAPTKKGAALAAARYGADPKLVEKMLAGDPKAQKLAAKKSAEKLAENRQDYEITLQLVRKGEAPRVVEEIVGGKLVSLQQPGAKRVSRRNGSKSWEERGMSTVVRELPLRLYPLADEARILGRAKGEMLRSLALAKKPSVRGSIARGLDDNDYAFRKEVAEKVAEFLGDSAYDDAGRATAELRQAVGVLRRVYDDTATVVQKGGILSNPAQRTKGIAKTGVGYHWKDIKTSRKEFTPVTLSATPPALDPDGVGYFLITFDSRRKDVERALREVGGWRFVPQVTSVGYSVGVATEAPAIHKVVPYRPGGIGGKRAASGQFGKGYYSIVGPKSKGEAFERKADAEEYARVLDLRAASFQVPQVHEVWKTAEGFEVRGPHAEEESIRRAEANRKREERGQDPLDGEEMIFADEGEAQRVAESLDYREASRGALPIKGYRTAPGMDGKKAVETYNKTLVALDTNRINFVLDPSVASVGQRTGAAQKRLAERAPERLAATLVARGEDTEKLIELAAEAEGRGRNKLVNLLAKSYADDATVTARKAAVKKFGAQKVSEILSADREKTKMKARMPGAFVQKMRSFGDQRRVGFTKEASDLEVLLAALYPDGEVPPTMLPKLAREQIRDFDDKKLVAQAKRKLGMSDAEIEKVLTSVERSIFSKLVAEREPESTVGLIGRGGFDVALSKKEAKRLSQQTAQLPKGPKPLREEAAREAAEKSRKEDRAAAMRAEIEALEARLAALQRKKNGLVSSGLRLARSGGQAAARYGRSAYSASRAWLATAAGQKLVAEVSGIAVALFGAKAVSSGKLTKEQAALVQMELERKTGRKADPARVAVALQLAGE